MTRDEMQTTAVVPAYEESDRIADVVRETETYVDEVLVVDDGSRDATAEVARSAGAHVLEQPENRGYIPAIKRGFRAATTEIVVTVDADGEMPVERIPELVEPIRAGHADMVQGARDEIPRPSEQLLTAVASLFGPVGDSGSGFRALRTDLARELELRGACICGIFSLEVLARGGTIEEIPIQTRSIDEPRGIAWFHLRQLGDLGTFVLRWRAELAKLDAGPAEHLL